MAALRPLLRCTSSSTISPALSPSVIAPFLRVPLTTIIITKPLPNTPRNQSQRPFSTSTTRMSAQPLIDASQTRRTIYKLGKNSPVPDSKIEELVNAAINTVPSSFNTQSTRLVVLLRAEHEKLWDLAIDTFSQLVNTGAVPEEAWKNQSLPKLQGFKNGVGTVCPFHWGSNCWTGRLVLTTDRSSSTKTPHTSDRSLRNSPFTKTTSSPGPSTRTPCTSITVRLSLSPFHFTAL